MTSLNPISDGQPLTYEKINEIIYAVNNLAKTAGGDTAAERIIEVFGPNITSSNNVQIYTGDFILNFGSIQNAKESIAQRSIQFGNLPFSAPPYVVVSAVDKTAPDNTEISYISLTVTEVTRQGFVCKGRRLIAGSDNRTKDQLTVNFIAIGPISSTAR